MSYLGIPLSVKIFYIQQLDDFRTFLFFILRRVISNLLFRVRTHYMAGLLIKSSRQTFCDRSI